MVRDTELMPHANAYAYLTLVLRWVHAGPGAGAMGGWESLLRLSSHGRPPAYPLLSAPFVASFGRSEDAALLVNLAFTVLLLVATFGIARECRGERAGLLAAFLVATYPPIVQVTRIYTAHAAVPACVALSLWALLVLGRTRSLAVSWGFGASLVLGTWTHPSFGLAMAVPALAGSLGVWLGSAPSHPRRALTEAPAWLRDRIRDRLFLFGLLPAGLAAASLTALWYLTKGQILFETYRQFSSPGTLRVMLQGTDLVKRGFYEVDTDFWWYLVTAPGALTLILALLLAAALVQSFLRGNAPTRLLALGFVGGYVLVNQQPGRAWFYFASLLPVAATLTAVFVTSIRQRRIAIGLAGVCIATGAFSFAVVSWGLPPGTHLIARALGARLDSPTCDNRANTVFCPNPPQQGDGYAADVVRRIHEDPHCAVHPCQLVVLRNDYQVPWHVRDFSYRFSQLVLESRKLEGWPDSPLKIITPATPASWNRRITRSDYVLYRDPPGAARRVVRDLLSKRTHREAASYDLEDGARAVLMRRE